MSRFVFAALCLVAACVRDPSTGTDEQEMVACANGGSAVGVVSGKCTYTMSGNNDGATNLTGAVCSHSSGSGVIVCTYGCMPTTSQGTWTCTGTCPAGSDPEGACPPYTTTTPVYANTGVSCTSSTTQATLNATCNSTFGQQGGGVPPSGTIDQKCNVALTDAYPGGKITTSKNGLCCSSL